MKKIVSKLIDYGMDFSYENFGSKGERIEVYELSVNISIQDGQIFINYEAETEQLKESDKSINYVVSRVNQIAIDATSSF